MSKQKKDKYITDFISGQQVKATPEEVEAVQVFSIFLPLFSLCALCSPLCT